MEDASGGRVNTRNLRASLADHAYYELRDRIVSLRLPPGGPVNEKAVMEDLGVSRTPVREALLRLEQERLVAIMPGRGTYVTEIDLSEVATIFEFRGGLESMAAELAATRHTAGDRERLDPLIEVVADIVDPASPGADPLRQMEIDQQAHALIQELAANVLLERTIESHYMLTARIWRLGSIEMITDQAFATMAHTLEAIRDRNPDAAREYARAHSAAAERSVRAGLVMSSAGRARST